MLVNAGGLLVCVTAIEKFCWTSAPVPSDTLSWTLFAPTLACVGVPDNVAVPFGPAVKVSQAGFVWNVIVKGSLSASVAVIE